MAESQTITLTYGDVCENHVGMEKIGDLASKGLSCELLQKLKEKYNDNCELIKLNTKPQHAEASVLIIRGGVNLLLNGKADKLYDEQKTLNPDKQALIRGRVVNKRARYNLCFSEQGKPADLKNGKGTVIGFQDVPLTSKLRDKLGKVFELKNTLQCEGNYYYDTTSKNVGIGYHGDTERRIVIGCRFGASIPIRFQWFQNTEPQGNAVTITLNHGDLYAMSEKATGFDWKRSSIPTLRHCAGSNDFLLAEEKRIKKRIDDRKNAAMNNK